MSVCPGPGPAAKVLEANQEGQSHHSGAHHVKCVISRHLWQHLLAHGPQASRGAEPNGTPSGKS
jgi:hypothetical protein